MARCPSRHFLVLIPAYPSRGFLAIRTHVYYCCLYFTMRALVQCLQSIHWVIRVVFHHLPRGLAGVGGQLKRRSRDTSSQNVCPAIGLFSEIYFVAQSLPERPANPDNLVETVGTEIQYKKSKENFLKNNTYKIKPTGWKTEYGTQAKST